MAKCEKCGAEYPDGTEHMCAPMPSTGDAPAAPAEAPMEDAGGDTPAM